MRSLTLAAMAKTTHPNPFQGRKARSLPPTRSGLSFAARSGSQAIVFFRRVKSTLREFWGSVAIKPLFRARLRLAPATVIERPEDLMECQPSSSSRPRRLRAPAAAASDRAACLLMAVELPDPGPPRAAWLVPAVIGSILMLLGRKREPLIVQKATRELLAAFVLCGAVPRNFLLPCCAIDTVNSAAMSYFVPREHPYRPRSPWFGSHRMTSQSGRPHSPEHLTFLIADGRLLQAHRPSRRWSR